MRDRARIPEATTCSRISKSAQIRKRRRRGRGRNERPTFSAGWRHRSSSFGLLTRGLGFGLCLLLGNCDRQGEKIDESFGVFRIVARHGEAGEIRSIERIGRLARCYCDIAPVKRERN